MAPFRTTPATAETRSGNPRLRLLVFPREHGAWGMWAVPLVTGAWIGFETLRQLDALVLLALGALSLFLLRAPLESLLGTSPVRPQTPTERFAVVVAAAFYAASGGIALGVLIWARHAYGLLILGAGISGIFLAQAALKKLGRQTRLSAQLIGSAGLTGTAAAAYYVAAGRFDSTAYALWAMNWLFAANQIQFVQARIHAGRMPTRAEKFDTGRNFLLGQVLTALFLGLAWERGWLPALALLAFVPALFRGLSWCLSSRPSLLEIHRLGLSELAQALAFGALLILGFSISSR